MVLSCSIFNNILKTTRPLRNSARVSIIININRSLIDHHHYNDLNKKTYLALRSDLIKPPFRKIHSSPSEAHPKMALFKRLEDVNVLITGASGGIGAATAILFARVGANVLITARRQAELDKVKGLAEKANKEGGTGKGGRVRTLTLDMQDKAAVEGFLARVPDEFKSIDILVNNAGLVCGVDHVGNINMDEVDTMFNTNVLGLIRLTQNIVRGMKERGKGHIINLGSIAGREPYAGGSIYTATKHALRAFSGALLRELVSTPIRVSEVQPGMVETEFSVTRFRGDRSKANAVYEGLKPLVAEDIAEEIVWCASRPPHVNIAELFVLPTSQATPTLNHRLKD